MIPSQNIVAWANVVPWVEPRQVEQDLIISRALIEMFGDRSLREALRFRGGTALNKLHFPTPSRYSEDVDLVRTSTGPIGPIVDRLRAVLEPWLGQAQFARSPVAPKLRFRVDPEDGSGGPIRLKIEINTREIQAFDPPVAKRLEVTNPWFTGQADVPTFSPEEMLATKLRALLQRNKGRDLYDLAHGLATGPRTRCRIQDRAATAAAASTQPPYKRQVPKVRSPVLCARCDFGPAGPGKPPQG